MTSKPLTAAQMPVARITRIHWHWTAGTYANAQADASGHYHFVYGSDGRRYQGKSIALNGVPAKKGYAAHTLNANTGAIGLSVACMGGNGVSENPFRSGLYPMTEAQMRAMIADTAQLCLRYDVPVTPRTVLSHAEVQANLGIAQRGKWDIARMSWKPELVGAKACGDWMRAEVVRLLNGYREPEPMDPGAKPARYVVRGVTGNLNFRNAPNGVVVGSLKNGNVVEKLDPAATALDAWWNVRTTGGFVGWVASDYLAPA